MLSGDNSILQKATDAKTRTDEAQIREKIRLAYNSALTKDITEQNGEVQQSTFEDELKVEFPDKTISISDSSDKKEWIVTIDEVSENVPIGKNTPKLADLVEIGDYVTYDATSGDGYGLTITAEDIAEIVQTIDTSTNEKAFIGGADITGNFTSGDITKWRVISIDNGIVRIVGETPTVNKVLFGGTEGFKYAKTVLDKISEIYGKGKGAISAKSIILNDFDLNYDNIPINESEYTYTSGTFFRQIRNGTKVTGYENILVEASDTNSVTIKQTTLSNSVGGPSIFNNSEKMWSVFSKASAGDGFWFPDQAIMIQSSSNANYHLFCGSFGTAIYNGDALFHSVVHNGNKVGPHAVLPVVSLKSNIMGTRTETGEGDNKIVTWNLDV